MRFFIYSFSILLLLCSFNASFAQDFQSIADQYLKDKIKITGSLTVYDEQLDQVRNLRLMEWTGSEEDAGEVLVKGDFRDLDNGDILAVQVQIEDEMGKKIEILEVKSTLTDISKEDTKKDFTQDEIRASITKYIEQRSEFTKTYDIFDPESQKFLKLNFDSFVGDMRTFGIMYIQTTSFLETQTGEKINFDITVKNVKGSLKVEKVKRR